MTNKKEFQCEGRCQRYGDGPREFHHAPDCPRNQSTASTREDLAKREVNQCFKGRTFKLSDGSDGCAECCNGDRCDDATHRDRERCFYCYGTGRPVISMFG